jgi:2-isopropylmalate synthase
VANSIAAVLGGATQVQGTVNGYGERTGNANLMTVIPDLTLKLGVATLPEGHLERLTVVSHRVAELVNLPPHPADPFVGQSAFAHKGGLHTSALGRAGGATYEHIDPAVVGNHTRVLVSDLGGRAGMAMKAEEFGVAIDAKATGELSEQWKLLESEGWLFESADASLELRMRRATGWRQDFFEIVSYEVTSVHREADADISVATTASVTVRIDGASVTATGEGNGPVNALDSAVRSALGEAFPALHRIHLTDFKVRVVDGGAATGAVVRVLIDSTDGDRVWTTVGVDSNVIEASWQALMDSLLFGLLHAGE